MVELSEMVSECEITTAKLESSDKLEFSQELEYIYECYESSERALVDRVGDTKHLSY